jgi:Aspartyl/Asparaginyl beta-hydroxylase
MLSDTGLKFLIDPIVQQVSSLNFEKRLSLNSTTGKLFSGPYQTLPEFKGTPLGNLLDSLPNVGEARLLKLVSAESYTAHYDPDDRLQLAIITNKDAYLQDLDAKKMYHLPVDGTLWLMDTSKRHVASNFGGRDRVHLNIRVLLPEFHSPGVCIEFVGGDFDWKQELHESFMSYLNQAIKNNTVTGIDRISDRVLLLNCTDDVIKHVKSAAEYKGFTVLISHV